MDSFGFSATTWVLTDGLVALSELLDPIDFLEASACGAFVDGTGARGAFFTSAGLALVSGFTAGTFLGAGAGLAAAAGFLPLDLAVEVGRFFFSATIGF